VVTPYSPLLWLVTDTRRKAYTHARRSHNSQLPQEKQPRHNSLCSFGRREWRYYYNYTAYALAVDESARHC